MLRQLGGIFPWSSSGGFPCSRFSAPHPSEGDTPGAADTAVCGKFFRFSPQETFTGPRKCNLVHCPYTVLTLPWTALHRDFNVFGQRFNRVLTAFEESFEIVRGSRTEKKFCTPQYCICPTCRVLNHRQAILTNSFFLLDSVERVETFVPVM